MLVPRKAM